MNTILIGFIINSLEPPFIRDKILEPFLLIENMKKVPIDADIYVKGGGCISRVYGEYLITSY